jgi:hypothetical protein
MHLGQAACSQVTSRLCAAAAAVLQLLLAQMELAGETLAEVLAAHKKALNEPLLVGLMKQVRAGGWEGQGPGG